MIGVIDTFQYRSRMQPALLCILPISLTIAVVFGVSKNGVSGVIAFATSLGVTYFISMMVRDRGRRLEPGLWTAWGGAPTTQLLRGQGDESAAVQRRRWALMRNLLPDLESTFGEGPPNDDDIAIYVARLRELTRNVDNYRLVMLENAAYGFRRNLYGLRPVGVLLTGIAVIIALVSVFVDHNQTVHVEVLVIVLFIDLVSLIIWIAVVSRRWVREQGFNYARTLLSAAETIDSSTPT